MCLSNVYAVKDGDRELLFKNVAAVKQDGEKLLFSDILGVPSELQGEIVSIDLLENIILVKESNGTKGNLNDESTV